MRVSIEVNNEIIWFRDNSTPEGMASLSYLKDGTQQKIIAALKNALFQAEGECLAQDAD